jgi:hypothetical protein
MPSLLNIDLVQAHGACRPNCDILRMIFPDGEIVFDMSNFERVLAAGVNIMWAACLAPRPIQHELALAWYDRALATSSPPWKASLRKLLETSTVGAAADQLTARLAERRSATTTDPLEIAVSGVGYAAAALAGKFAEEGQHYTRTMAALVVLGQWCAQAAALAESKEMDVVYNEIRAHVWGTLAEHGAVLPAPTP